MPTHLSWRKPRSGHQGDAATLSSAKTYTDTAVAGQSPSRGQGDAATAEQPMNTPMRPSAEEASARESGDRATLSPAKDYVDKAIAELVDGSPGARRSRGCRPP